jgi:hypothetical protein
VNLQRLKPSAAATAGAADMLQLLGYMLGVSQMIFLAAAIPIKLALAAGRGTANRSPAPGIWFVAFIVGLSFFSMMISPYQDVFTAVKLAVFFTSLCLTLYLVAGDRALLQYGRALVNASCAVSLVYLAYAAAGRIDVVYGRHMYFAESHPNLGSEIGAMSIVVACMVYTGKGLYGRCLALLPPLFLMQGRAAIIASVLALALQSFGSYRKALKSNPGVIGILTAAALPVIGLVLAPIFVTVARSVLKLDDVYRGGGTGFVGRSDRWQTAINLFFERPLFGNGPAVYDVLGIEDPHSFFMFGIANLGLSFVAVVALLGYFTYRATKEQPSATKIMAPLLLLLFFNDRFINMAPYPFLAYVYILSLAAPQKRQSLVGSSGNKDEFRLSAQAVSGPRFHPTQALSPGRSWF